MTQPKPLKFDLSGNLSLLIRLNAALSHLIEDDIKNLPAGKQAEAGTSVTDMVLSDTLKALLAVCDKAGAVYKEKKDRYSLLCAGDKKMSPLKELILAEKDYEFTFHFFWLSFRAEYGNKYPFHRRMGFDESFRVWVGDSIIRGPSDLPTFPNRSVANW